jgi:plastocyanin
MEEATLVEIWHRRIRIVWTLTLVGTVLGACAYVFPAVRPADAGQNARSIAATVGNGVMQPFVLTASPGDTVVWRNDDIRTHRIAAAVEPAGVEGSQFPMTLGPGEARRMTPVRAGVYDLYGADAATFDPILGRVVANRGEPPYPIPMEQILVVMGPGFAPAPKKGATVIAPGDVFQPYVTVVRAGSTVTFRNEDTDPHIVAAAPNSANRLPKTVVLPGGGSASLTFPTPGVFQYYCSLHATYRAAYQRAAAIRRSDRYPTAMDGVVVVVPGR